MKRIVLLALALAGCGGGSVKLADYGDAYHEAYCKYLTRCGAFGSVDECLDANIGLTIHISPSEIAAEDAGKFDFDGGKAKSCLDKLANASCDRTSEDNRNGFDQECQEIVQGNGQAGDACAEDVECASQSCDIPTCTDACCQGTCNDGTVATAPLEEGDACSFSDQCDVGLYCTQDTQECAKLKSSGATCESDDECDYGTGCLFSGSSDTGTCGTLPDTGEACTGECAHLGDVCVNSVCTSYALEGDACSETAPCSPFYVCDTGGHCAARVAAGGACTSSSDCADYGAFCDDPTDSGTGTCVDPQPNGAACDSSSMCQSAFCDSTTQKCADEAVCI